MRHLGTLAALAIAAVLFFYWQRGETERSSAERAAALAEKRETAATAAAADAKGPTPIAERSKPTHRVVGVATGGGIALRVAAGRPLETRVFRNGDYPKKVVWLITRLLTVRTHPDGSLRLPPLEGRKLVFTDPDSSYFVLQELGFEVKAVRKVKVSGVLRDAQGEILDTYWMGAQLGRPEDWQTRTHVENDSFVTATGDLEIDPEARYGTVTGPNGRFVLQLVPGNNTFFFGENREHGTLPMTVPKKDVDLGDLHVPPRAAQATLVPRPLHGQVLNHAGEPHPGVRVMLWAGTVGAHSHETRSDAQGRFSFKAVKSEKAILWAVSTDQPHLTLPSQSSGTVLLPCDTPVILRAPAPPEYTRIRPRGLRGFFLFLRDDVMLGGNPLDKSSIVGLPPGRYRIIVLTRDERILEGSFAFEGGGERFLEKKDFRETT